MGIFEALDVHRADDDDIIDYEVGGTEDDGFMMTSPPFPVKPVAPNLRIAPDVLSAVGMSRDDFAVSGGVLLETGVTEYVYFVTKYSKRRIATLVSEEAMYADPERYMTNHLRERLYRIGPLMMESIAIDSLVDYVFSQKEHN